MMNLKDKYTKGIVGANVCIFAVVTTLLGGVILNNKINKRIQSVRQELVQHEQELAIINERMSLVRYGTLDDNEHHVLCLGNSITIHPPKDSIYWYSNHGMAASSTETDYCHILEKKFKYKNIKSSVTPVNIAKWEMDFAFSMDTILQELCAGKDIVIIRLGENVRSVDKFADALDKLIIDCQRYTTNIVLTGVYWPDENKENVIIEAARKYSLRYVPLDWIWKIHNKECSPLEGDTIYDENKKAYPIRGTFITTHPNDKGMELIANSIYNAL